MEDLSELQYFIMLFIKRWANNKKTTIPQKNIIMFMEGCGEKSYNTLNALSYLMKKEYIRKAYNEIKNRTFYVMIRNI
jgi:hypothetical protein